MNQDGTGVAELMELEREILRLFLAGKVDQVMDEHMMEDAMVCPPGMGRIVGRENQRVLFKELLKTNGVELTWEPVEAHVSPSEEMGYVFGSVRWKMPDEAEQEGKYISVWVKEGGKWRNAVEIRNANR